MTLCFESYRLFVICLAAFGCADVTPPDGTTVDRHGDEAVIHCENSDMNSVVKCENDTWNGKMPSCRSVNSNSTSQNINISMQYISYTQL